MDDSESNLSDRSDETSESSSEGEEIVDIASDKDFFKTLSCLKNKDPKIYDKNVEFFRKSADDEVKKIKQEPTSIEKPVFVKDYVVGFMDGVSDEEESPPKHPTYAEEQQATKQFFKSELENNSSSEDESEALMKIKVKSENDQKEEDADYIQFLKGNKSELGDKDEEKELKPLCEFWNKKDLDEGEEFLKDYILNRKYLSKDFSTLPNAEDLSEDERALEEQAEFEDKYNRRFETEENLAIRRFPRNIEGSLRRKDDSRRNKRAEIALRKKEEKEKKRNEIKKKQKEVLVEMEERYKEIENLTQNPELGVEDFDPEVYDKKMSECFNEEFYNQEEDEHPTFNEDDYNGWDYEEIDMDCEASNLKKEGKKLTRSKKKKMNKKKAFTDIMEIAKPSFDPEVHNDFKEYFDKYYNLDCEDFIDDLPCRYKYNDVVPNDFGLTVEEILMADDSELNAWASLKKISKIRPVHVEKNEVKVYSKKAQNEFLKRKILPSLFSNENEDQSESKETLLDSSNVVGKNEVNCNRLEANGRNIQSEIDTIKNTNDNTQLDIKPKNCPKDDVQEILNNVIQENKIESKKRRKRKHSNNCEMILTENSEIKLDQNEKSCNEDKLKSKNCPKDDVQENFDNFIQENKIESKKRRKRKHSNNCEMILMENSEIKLDQKDKSCNEDKLKSKNCPKDDVQENFDNVIQENKIESKKRRKSKHSNNCEMILTENSEIKLDQNEKSCNEDKLKSKNCPKDDVQENFDNVIQENKIESKKRRKRKHSNNSEIILMENSEIKLDQKEKSCNEDKLKSKNCLNVKNDVQGIRPESRKKRKRLQGNNCEMNITENSEISLDDKQKPCNENNEKVRKNDVHNGKATCSPKKKRRKKKPSQKNVDLSKIPKDKTNIDNDSIQQNNPAQLKSKQRSRTKNPNNWKARNTGDVTKLSDDRLRAYGFKPKQFRAKMKYSKMHQASK